MDPSPSIYISIIIFCLLCSTFFSGSETALFSLGRWRLIRLREEGHPKYSLIDGLLARPRRLLISIIIGNDMCNVVASALATPLAVKHFGASGRWVAIVIMTGVIIILCDISPKVLAISHPVSIASFAARPMSLFVKWVAPVRWLAQSTVDVILRVAGLPRGKRTKFILEKDFLRLVEHGHRAGIIERLERDFIRRAMEFGDTKVAAIMTPRPYIFAVPLDADLSLAIEKIKTRGFSRVPVYEHEINKPVGILHVKDLVGIKLKYAGGTVADLSSRLKPVYYVPETKNVEDLFQEFQKRRIHLAMVVDEYGDLAGLVTMEDILEELFGEIYDEYDQKRMAFEEKGKGVYLVSPRMLIEDFNEITGAHIPSDEVETIGGFVLNLFGELPREGDSAAYNDLRFTVTKIKGTRILQLKVEREGKAAFHDL
ncbi:MAG: hemolysin family protein [Thermodesulfobacteriota bacterium]|nr:hemolysin family protein [Thermodesulfobacteriota bacterium]